MPIPFRCLPSCAAILPADEYLADSTAGSVTRRSWTPNAIELDVALSRPTELLINQNFHTGWRSNVGQVRDHDGLLAIALPAGAREVRLSFRPRSAIAGALSSILAFIIAGWLIRRERRQRREPRSETTPLPTRGLLAAAAGIPLLLFAMTYALIPESRAAPARLRAPSGEEVLAPQLPADAAPVGATFGHGIVLEGVRAPAASSLIPGAPAAIELDWRVVGPVPREVDIVVSFESGGANLAQADHGLVSAALRFADAPRGTVLRDLVPFIVPAFGPPVTGTESLDVWVGLRDGDSHRPLRVAASNQVTRSDARLLVATLRPATPR